MITLTRLNGKPFTLNALYIEQVEAFPDTTITLTNGKKFVVRESIEEITSLVTIFYRKTNVIGLQENVEG
jgi:flagellar protein FlbD